MDPVAVYIHTPFCPSKCGYCDFNSYAMEGEIIDRTVAATVEEIERGRHRGRPAKTIFFGGGTPTFLRTDQLLRIFTAVVEAHPPVDNCEITSEANPGTADADKFTAMRAAGFNRLSLGAQSFKAADLLRLGRVHGPSEIGEAVAKAHDAGFENVNVDLMFALPGQAMTAWDENLKAAFALGTEHLSLYCLSIEPNTAFYKQNLRGQLDLPNDEAQTRMYDRAVSAAEGAGLRQYEISNFARPGFECRHNLCYWRNEDYIGYGPGAVEKVAGRRRTNIKHPARYCDAVENRKDLACESESLDAKARSTERIMLGLRLNEGMPAAGLREEALRSLCDKGWLEREGEKIRLTRSGRHYCNQAIVALI